MFEKIKKLLKPKPYVPKTVTLQKYKIKFTSLDGKVHEFNRLNYADPTSILCSIGEYYLIGKDFLQADDLTVYPITNIQKIEFVLVKELKNVIRKTYGYNSSYPYIWYSNEDIEICQKPEKEISERGKSYSNDTLMAQVSCLPRPTMKSSIRKYIEAELYLIEEDVECLNGEYILSYHPLLYIKEEIITPTRKRVTYLYEGTNYIGSDDNDLINIIKSRVYGGLFYDPKG